MKVGESQSIKFAGTAVHNGGSCQLSLTPGYKPTASSPFKVILSIEGGCPGLDGQTTTYDYKIPEEIPDGNYTFAWTWYNNIGNREIYMNCARMYLVNNQLYANIEQLCPSLDQAKQTTKLMMPCLTLLFSTWHQSIHVAPRKHSTSSFQLQANISSLDPASSPPIPPTATSLQTAPVRAQAEVQVL
jgi:hypothetical protein